MASELKDPRALKSSTLELHVQPKEQKFPKTLIYFIYTIMGPLEYLTRGVHNFNIFYFKPSEF